MKKLMMLALAGFCLCSCGVKPGGVESPSGAENDSFPQTYPDVSTDPKP